MMNENIANLTTRDWTMLKLHGMFFCDLKKLFLIYNQNAEIIF